jgi:hypothetical protein
MLHDHGLDVIGMTITRGIALAWEQATLSPRFEP